MKNDTVTKNKKQAVDDFENRIYLIFGLIALLDLFKSLGEPELDAWSKYAHDLCDDWENLKDLLNP